MVNKKKVQQAHDDLLKLGELTVKFADVHRIILYPDGHYENDAEHSFHLAISATEIAASYHPELDLGLVSQLSIVHDLPEIYAGDVPSFSLSNDERSKKEKAEKVALEKLLNELPSHTAKLLKRYEDQKEPEARFVRLIDKILPAVIHAVATEANKEDFLSRYNITGVEDIDRGNEIFLARLQQMFPEFDSILVLRELVAKTSRNRLFPSVK
jgi:5'-deoxynucleotidase YfbR-like HD superfamily hydrolase